MGIGTQQPLSLPAWFAWCALAWLHVGRELQPRTNHCSTKKINRFNYYRFECLSRELKQSPGTLELHCTRTHFRVEMEQAILLRPFQTVVYTSRRWDRHMHIHTHMCAHTHTQMHTHITGHRCTSWCDIGPPQPPPLPGRCHTALLPLLSPSQMSKSCDRWH